MLFLSAIHAHAAEVSVFAAASLTDALKQLAVNYERQTGDKIIFNLGASSTLARQIEEGAPADIFFSADEAKMDGLAKKGLIVSQNGPKGGYALARHPAEITVGEVVRALEGPINIVSCLEHNDCPQMERCSLRHPVKKIQAAITQVLDTMSLAELTSDDVPQLLSVRG